MGLDSRIRALRPVGPAFVTQRPRLCRYRQSGGNPQDGGVPHNQIR